jgi:hypothetical protein
MTRERSTWNINNIAKQAGLKVADPYTMNQDHQQPAADAYVTGDPSAFAEDVHPAAGTWEAEYSGGQVKRNEIGMPEMRNDTFNHSEKTASEELLVKKAAVCVALARSVLPKTASSMDIEEQSISFMHLPDEELMSTFTRLAAQQDQQDQGQKQAAQDQQAQQDQDQGKKQAAQDQQDQQGQQEQDQKKAAQDQQTQQDQGQKQAAQDQQAQMQQQLAQMIEQAQHQLQQLQAQAQQQQVAQQQPQAQMQQQSQAQQVAQAVQQAVQQGQDPVAAAAACMAQYQQGQPQQQVGSDGELIDQMLAQQQTQQPMANMDIELDTPTMDVGEVQIGPEDDMLMQLFANAETEQAQQAQDGGQQQKQAHAVRTASMRTVGTVPTQGVSRIGGTSTAKVASGGDQLSSLWSSAPDVRDAFGIPTNR